MRVLAVSQNVSLLDQPGTVAFLVVFGMAVMLFFVFRSMSKHLRTVNQAARDEAEAAARAAESDGAAEHGGAAEAGGAAESGADESGDTAGSSLGAPRNDSAGAF